MVRGALAQKFLRNWPEAYRLGVLAAAAAPRGRKDPAFWNLGIAATILRDWDTARDAWEGFGITLPAGDGPIEGNFGRACVRINGDNGSEVVWVQRLCPTRARVVNVPFDTSRRKRDPGITAGAPVGNSRWAATANNATPTRSADQRARAKNQMRPAVLPHSGQSRPTSIPHTVRRPVCDTIPATNAVNVIRRRGETRPEHRQHTGQTCR